MLGARGKLLHEPLKALLTVFTIGILHIDIPVLRTSLHESHRHTKGVHLLTKHLTAEQHFFRHILMTVEHGLYFLLSTRQTQIGMASVFYLHLSIKTLCQG